MDFKFGTENSVNQSSSLTHPHNYNTNLEECCSFITPCLNQWYQVMKLTNSIMQCHVI